MLVRALELARISSVMNVQQRSIISAIKTPETTCKRFLVLGPIFSTSVLF